MRLWICSQMSLPFFPRVNLSAGWAELDCPGPPHRDRTWAGGPQPISQGRSKGRKARHEHPFPQCELLHVEAQGRGNHC